MTDEEKQDLEALRKEKDRCTHEQRVQKILEAAGISSPFADLLAGSNAVDTGKQRKRCCPAYQAVLAENIRFRLPEKPPVVTSIMSAWLSRDTQRIR